MECRILSPPPFSPLGLTDLHRSKSVLAYFTRVVQSTSFLRWASNPMGAAMKQSCRAYSIPKTGTLLSQAYVIAARRKRGNQFLPCRIFSTSEANRTTEGERGSLALEVFAPSFTLPLMATLSTFCCSVAFGLNDQPQHPFAVKNTPLLICTESLHVKIEIQEGQKRFLIDTSFINN